MAIHQSRKFKKSSAEHGKSKRRVNRGLKPRRQDGYSNALHGSSSWDTLDTDERLTLDEAALDAAEEVGLQDSQYREREARERETYIRGRVTVAYEDEIAQKILEAVGLINPPYQLWYPRPEAKGEHLVAMETLFDLGEFREHFPLILDACAYPASVTTTFLPDHLPPLKKMVREFHETRFHAGCVERPYDPDRWDGKGLGVVFSYAKTNLLLHNRPDLAEGPSWYEATTRHGDLVAIHPFDPLLNDLGRKVWWHMGTETAHEMYELDGYWGTANWDDYTYEVRIDMYEGWIESGQSL